MSQTIEQNRKIGFEPGNTSVSYKARSSEFEDLTTNWQDYLRDRSQSQVIIDFDPEKSFWKSPDVIEGAVQDNHRNAGWLARGETMDENGNASPTFSEKIIQPKVFNGALRLAEAGQDAPALWGCSEEWYNRIYAFVLAGVKAKKEGKTLNHALAEAGIIDSQSYPTLERVDKQVSIEQAETQTHIFRQVATLETTEMLDITKIFTFVGPGISRHTLGDYRVPYPKKGIVTSVELQELDKDQAHISWSEEFFMKNYDLNIRELNIASIPFQMEKSKQYKIATVIDAITPVTGTDWSTFVGGDSANNPYPEIDSVTTDIDDVEGNVNTFVSNNRVYHAWLHNTYVTGTEVGRSGTPFGSLISGNRVVSGADGVNQTSLRWGIDSAMDIGDLAMYDIRAIRLRQGPQNQRPYQDVKTGVQGIIWKDFNLAYNFKPTWSKKLTGLAA